MSYCPSFKVVEKVMREQNPGCLSIQAVEAHLTAGPPPEGGEGDEFVSDQEDEDDVDGDEDQESSSESETRRIRTAFLLRTG